MNAICRLIGHRWVVKRRYSVDGMSNEELVYHDSCLRCGEPNPSVAWDQPPTLVSTHGKDAATCE